MQNVPMWVQNRFDACKNDNVTMHRLNAKLIRKKKKKNARKCPKCKSTRIASILYGMPAFSEKLEREMEDGKIVLGGCCVTDDDPKWQCADCGQELFRGLTIKKIISGGQTGAFPAGPCYCR